MGEFDDAIEVKIYRPPPSPADGGQSEIAWPQPQPLPSELLPVDAFDADFLPARLAPWAVDITERFGCPLDYVAIPAFVAMGALLGRRIGIRPQERTDWVEVPNQWGMTVGRPGLLKSPAMMATLAPLHRLEKEAGRRNKEALKNYEKDLDEYKRRQSKKGDAIAESGDPPEKPASQRYVTNDSSYEKAGEILAENPNGLLVVRDEMVSLLKTLDDEKNVAARGFYLQGWNGTSPYTFDRIGRGHVSIPAVCLSLLGSTQPGRLAEYVRRANEGGPGDDGLMQRFGLLVWPDTPAKWKDVDRHPDSEARESAWATFRRLDALTPDSVGAERDKWDDEGVPYLRFDPEALAIFRGWRADLERRLRSADLHPALESHFAKHRGLVPKLALISHLADDGVGPVSVRATLRALAMINYLETHARRCYGAGLLPDVATARAILQHIRNGDLKDGFSSRDVWRPQWAGLNDTQAVHRGLQLLVNFDWLATESVETEGRRATKYRINPKGRQ